ncbi:Asp-tRNA(Asn)/Glu-tRNA(Gln) amidotransferase subunit GatA [Candidatus Acetothermia bacterium]|jgi:aspartyl-tRNA(Asn)/glutamyl-tRNA(Gln) amidotransferase subunit A|nr:Asp-tRNA(Asn)/Glu-tRNA(Gln) amidotransferase subunit GatA [Candidatus Acetothermia bacterium]MCI2431078.1 Asp-tRNA(Asn)/Glu-tRNA(Gln) amidotransferase subunit GatA [Candidatus Acetothermia bacterium]MCI2435702.1 Asp-tRNA(Asn)/Glu-tRNA(Gln) amidotransferase subunit GatA [Candidatus Acetothermia bacterium]
MRLNAKPLHELLDLLERKEIHPREVVADLYRTIAEREKQIRAYISLAPHEELLQECERLSEKPLRGLPIAIKDNISTRDFKTTCASRFLKDFQPIFDATVVQRLREAGTTILGKTNLDEFAMGSSAENSAFFPTRNPHDPERVPGGSSGGSAAAVAAHEALCALGSDTGGSIRQPASFCGIVGLKPTYGLVSRYGLVAFASSLDQIGPMTQDVRDCALLLNMIVGRDSHDSTSLERPCADYTQELGQEITGFRVGVPKEYIADLSGQAKTRVESWVKTFRELGTEIVELSLPHTKYAIPTYYLVSSSEASANLARFDGVRYTQRVSDASDASVEAMFSESRDQGFGPEVKRRIMIGTYALSAGYYEAWYGKAQRVRALIRQDFESAFKSVDIILSPTSPTPAFKLGERVSDPLAMYLSDIFTVPASLAGLPAISIPGGRVDGLPFGLQIIADKFCEAKLLRSAYAFEQMVRRET